MAQWQFILKQIKAHGLPEMVQEFCPISQASNSAFIEFP